MGLYKGQNIITGSYMLPRADDNRQVNVSRKRMHIKKRRKREERRQRKRGKITQQKSKQAGNTKNICQKNTSLPRLRLGGL
jgi:hypothetical protein